MSSLFNSLLTELGFQTLLPRITQPRAPAEALPNGQPDPPSEHTSYSADSSVGIDCGQTKQISGDAGSLPGPPFFTTLQKDMDGRIPEPEGLRAMRPHGSDANSPSISVTNITPSVPSADLNSPIHSTAMDDQQLQQGGTPDQSVQPLAADLPVTQDGIGQSSSGRLDIDETGQTSLPADDGMGWLRNKIHAIRDLDLDNNEKARMIHELMTESYNSSRSKLPISPSSMSPNLNSLNQKHASRPSGSETKRLSSSTPASPALPASILQDNLQFSLTPEDLEPTYVPRAIEPESPVAEEADAADEDQDTEECDEAVLGCQHYHRNVKLECHTCKKWYTCRFCHDAAEDHPLIRRDTENMLCMLCGHAQPAAQICRYCDGLTAQYFCDICKLWDNDSKKSIYHCHDCGICRIGQGLGKDFFHCKTCCVCLPISIEDTHRCIERSTQCDCPICGDYMFTSPETVVVMRCGHSLHHKCLSEYSKTSFRCPICSKTITNMESTFRNLDRTIESQPMPADFKDTKGLIYCNDCGAKSIVRYHWLGLKCDLCESYNTAQLRILQEGDISEVLAEEGVEDITSRLRSESLNPDSEPATSVTALHPDMNATSPRLSAPISAGSHHDRRFVSYNMIHGRAISPVVSNYFGLPTERESEKPSSLPFFGSASRADGETEYGALNFLSKKLRDRYGFLAGESATAEGTSAVGEDEDDDEDEDEDLESSSSSNTDEEDPEEDDDDDDDGEEHIDIFGHR